MVFAGYGDRPHSVLDFLPLEFGNRTRFQNALPSIYGSGPGLYEASRKLILKGADVSSCVADSQEERLDANFETMENLQEHLKEHNLKF